MTTIKNLAAVAAVISILILSCMIIQHIIIAHMQYVMEQLCMVVYITSQPVQRQAVIKH